MRATVAVIAYTPHTDQIEVGRLGDVDFQQRTRHLRMSEGAVFAEVRDLDDFIKSQAQVLADFVTVVVRDGVDVGRAMEEFSKIEEFRDALDPELLAAKYWPERHAQSDEPVWTEVT